MELVNEYIGMIADYSQQKSLNLDIQLNTNIKGSRRWVISVGEPTGFMGNWMFREHGESLLTTLKTLWEKLPYKEPENLDERVFYSAWLVYEWEPIIDKTKLK